MSDLTPNLTLLLNLIGKDTAYLDPGSGSFIIQLIIASLVGAGFILRGYWSKITSKFRSTPTEGDDEEIDDGI